MQGWEADIRENSCLPLLVCNSEVSEYMSCFHLYIHKGLVCPSNFSIDAYWKIKFKDTEVSKTGKGGWNQTGKDRVLFVAGRHWAFLSWWEMWSDQVTCEGWIGGQRNWGPGEQLGDTQQVRVRVRDDANETVEVEAARKNWGSSGFKWILLIALLKITQSNKD